MVTCQAWCEDDDGYAIQTEGVCDREAEWVSCVPFVGARTCTKHKCRCAKLIEARVGVLQVRCLSDPDEPKRKP